MARKNSPERAEMLANRRQRQRNRQPSVPAKPMTKKEREYRKMI